MVVEGAEAFDEELFERGGPGKQARVAKVGLHEHAVCLHCHRVGERAHGTQNNVIIKVLLFFFGEKREEFFF
jgi:hypothetical protein